MATLRLLDRPTILGRKLACVCHYLQVKESISRVVNGVDSEWFDGWVGTIFKGSKIILELARIERSKIESMVVRSLRMVFLQQA